MWTGWPAGWPPTAAPGAAWSSRARPTGCGSWTATRTIPPSWPPTSPRRRDIAEGGRVLAIFQPHLFSRTRIFAAELGAALGRADEAFVLDVYPAREDPEPGVTGELVVVAVPGGRAHFVPDRAAVPAAVAATAKPGDLVLTMGAGDVTALGQPVLDALRARGGPAG